MVDIIHRILVLELDASNAQLHPEKNTHSHLMSDGSMRPGCSTANVRTCEHEHAQYPEHTGKQVVDPDLEVAEKCFLRPRLGLG